MLFSVYALDKPGAQEIRLRNRSDHLAYVAETGCVKVAGPLLDDDGEQMIGSLLIIEADEISAVERWLENDPYAKAGLFQSVSVRPWKWVIGAPQ